MYQGEGGREREEGREREGEREREGGGGERERERWERGREGILFSHILFIHWEGSIHGYQDEMMFDDTERLS